MLLAYHDLVELVNSGVVSAPLENVNASSIDICLGYHLLVEVAYPDHHRAEVDISRKQSLEMVQVPLDEDKGYVLHPGEFVLAASREVFNLPLWISAEYKLKSSMARVGLEHLNAGWCDPGWSNSHLTLELKNVTQHHALLLRPGMKIGQVVFFRNALVPEDHSYRAHGRYNNQVDVTPGKGIQ